MIKSARKLVTPRHEAARKIGSLYQIGPDTPDWGAARESLQHLASMNPKIVATGHGLPLRGERMLEDLRDLAENFDQRARPWRGRYVERPALTNLHGVVNVPRRLPLRLGTKLAIAGAAALAMTLAASFVARRIETRTEFNRQVSPCVLFE